MAVSLPSIHEMFPAHLMHRDGLDGEQMRVNRSVPWPTGTSSTCTITGCHCSSASTSSSVPLAVPLSTNLRTRDPQSHPHTDLNLQPCLHRTHDASALPGPQRLAAASLQSNTHAQVYPPHTNTVVAHAQMPAPGPSSAAYMSTHTRFGLGWQQCPSESERHHPPTQSPGYPDLPYRQPRQRTVDASDGEEDASEGELDPNPTSMKMHPTHTLAAYPGAPSPFPEHAKGMSAIPRSMPMNVVYGAPSEKKHVCPTCSKRFNRPSSLRIHANTHTGATPFHCPWPNCGREFNVNSNMRRHYRNHAITAYTSTSSSSFSSSNVHPCRSVPVPSAVRGPITIPNPFPPPIWEGQYDRRVDFFPAPPLRGHSCDAPDDQWTNNQRPERGARHANSSNQFQREYVDIAYRLQNERGRSTRPSAGNGGYEGEVDASDGHETDVEVQASPYAEPARAPHSQFAYPGPPARIYSDPNPSPTCSSSSLPCSLSSQPNFSPSPSPSPSFSPSSPPLSAFSGASSRSSHSSHSPLSPAVSPAAEVKPRYTPSTLYSQGVADTPFSTVLRPAFAQASVGGWR